MQVTYTLPREKTFYQNISLISNNRLYIRTEDKEEFSWQLAEDRDWYIEHIVNVSVDEIRSTDIYLSYTNK